MADFPTEGAPPFINRKLSIAEWNSYVAGYDFGRLAPSRLVLHHTAVPTEAQWAGLSTMRGMQRFYAGKGWTSGPHIYTGPDGVWLATPMSQIGIHAGTGNGSLAAGWYSIGLEMVGSFDHVRPAGAVWEHAKAVMAGISRRLQIPPRQLISFHRDYTNQKSCPGWAVTKDWVWGEVEAYMSNVAPPPAPSPGPIGTPTPSDEALLEALLNESYGKRSGAQGYNPDWAFHQYAVSHSLGMPMGQSTKLMADGKTYNYQPFARDTLYCEVPNWGDVKTLSGLLGGSIPPSGLGRMLLEATYASGGATFHADWAMHQFAMTTKLGPPIGNSAQISVDGKAYAYQAFAADTLYNLVPNWSDIKMLSQIAAVTDPAGVRLRDALLAATYKQAGATYHPDWAFHQLARGFNIGAPLGEGSQIKLEQTTYAIQVYALDALYNVVPNWSAVKRLRDLASSQGMAVLGAAMEEADAPQPDGAWEPPTAVDLHIVRASPQATAWGERGGRAIDMLVLHGLPGAADDTLAAMTALGSRFATHYYVGLDGAITQLVDEDKAAWHAGMATLSGTWYNLNRSSIGVGLERPAGWPAAPAQNTDAQILALRWLMRTIDLRHGISAEGVLLWGSLASSDADSLDGLPLDVLREVLA
ncbi:N-acetylmuramoyl-L-alanine amidase [Oscillochloris sp. ZM17-4]|uniref:N-acetylmuramoyl-L-alanine amidase n=1 Tax=Oscillochloris sp. ZM17-4 TaxID=2866714 RepID=UPI001C734585|nr:N-acetylmuramoyl-L-alanine amidase [Oscillochloris sp. ZM17-4]MBX0327012.1 N-acetylmuramoyl-L-alanine amidase [Oscillochloris sp. ZM17-4]